MDNATNLTKADVQFNTRRAGMVTRYHTWVRARDQSVGEHSWQVMRLHIEIFGMPRAEVFQYIVYHDAPEVAIGDPPYPVKKNNPDLDAGYTRLEDDWYDEMKIFVPDISALEYQRFKFCDLFDCAEHGLDELRMGNQYMAPIADQVPGLMGLFNKLPSDDQLRAARYARKAGIRLDPGQMQGEIRSAYFGG